MYSRRNKKITKSLKDYLVPVIGWFILLFIVYNIVSSGGDEKTPTTQQTPIIVDVDTQTTQAYVEYSGGKKTQIETTWVSLYPWEKVSLSTTWNAKLNLKEGESLHLNKLGNVLYVWENKFTLYASDLFVNVSTPTQFDLRYMQVNTTWANQVFNLNQTDVSSSIYVLDGSVQVKNTAWVSVMVGKGERLSIIRNEAGSKDIDLNARKELIDEYVKTDDWFILNNGNTFLSRVDTNISETGTWNVQEQEVSGWFWYVQFDLLDESDAGKDVIDITWELLDEVVYKVEINGQTAEINVSDRTFVLKSLKLTSRINDIVYRVFDESNRLLDKWVLTLYYAQAPASTPTSWQNQWVATVENYSLAVSPLYTIVAPKSNPYITTENNVRLEWTVPARTVERIVINDFQLTKFPRHGTYWYYFANAEFWNLKEWLNIYKIQYYGAENKLLYENTFTIVKETPKPVVTPTVPVVDTLQPLIETIEENILNTEA